MWTLLGLAVGSEEPWRIIKDLTRQKKSAQGIQAEEEDKPMLDSPACDIERLEVEPLWKGAVSYQGRSQEG